MLSIAMPTYRRGTPEEGRALWGDLRVCLHSIEAYALDYVDEIVVAWDGPWAPDGMPEHPKFRYLQRPPGMDMAAAWEWAIEQTSGDELIHMGDDVVLHPDTFRLLAEDIQALEHQRPDARLGIIGARSNAVAGLQNIRLPNGGTLNGWQFTSELGVIEFDQIYNVFSWYTRAAWEHVGRFPKGCIWWGDNLFSYDLKKLGYTHFISRAYVHHIGMRGSAAEGSEPLDLLKRGIDWMQLNRPDFFEYAREFGVVSDAMLEAAELV